MDILERAGAEGVVEAVEGFLRGRVDDYEIYFSAHRGVNVESKDGKVDFFKVKSGAGVGVRTLKASRLGFSFTNVLEKAALEAMVDSAVEGSGLATADEALGFPEPGRGGSGLDAGDLLVYDPSLLELPEDEKIGAAVAVEEAARSHDRRITKVRSASFSESVQGHRVVNSKGVDVTHRATYCSASVMAVAEADGSSEMGWEVMMGHSMADVDPRRVGRAAAERAVSMLGAGRIETVRSPAVLENLVALELVEALASSVLADNVCKGRSMLAGRLGEKVVSEAVSIRDDGLLRGGWNSSLRDAEGVARRTTCVIERGVLRSYLYDTYWAGRSGAESTGNASRSGYGSVPAVALSNVYVEAGDLPLDALIAEMGEGLFITELMGVHTIDRVSGDFSIGAGGFRVEGGRVGRPVRGMAVAGNLLELFSRVERTGSDLRFMGAVGAPSILLGRIDASGT
ncbi:MAG TPA: TldD/PmbA family protein [Deltaproteobacteria bacterium]|nr:TldD/PmbA family protein [Deltaproteobacteria bacterium]